MSKASKSVPFPPVSTADESGLLAVGGRMAPEWLLEAYRRGIFPWPIVDGDLQVLAWFAPDPRAILPLDRLHVSRRLARRIRSGQFQVTCDKDFAAVVAGCAQPRKPGDQTWITPSLARAYLGLHELGYAHSVEVWSQGRMAGGVYGVALGGFFSGESMFHTVRDASKAALFHLVQHLRSRGYQLFDSQQTTPHLQRLGAIEIPRSDYLRRLRKAVKMPVTFGDRLEAAC